MIIYTGESRGLGKSMALCLAAKGRDIILTYNRRQAEADAVVGAIENMGRRAAALHRECEIGRIS